MVQRSIYNLINNPQLTFLRSFRLFKVHPSEIFSQENINILHDIFYIFVEIIKDDTLFEMTVRGYIFSIRGFLNNSITLLVSLSITTRY